MTNGLGNADTDNGNAGAMASAGDRGLAAGDVSQCSAGGHRHGNGGAVAGGVTPIPSSIVQAVCRIQGSLEAVKKTGRNPHGGYQFASTDDIYAALTRKMGEVGLLILPLEAESEVVRVEKDGKTVQWLKASFEFVLATADATWSDPRSKRSLFIMINGPQTHQAAASYAEKAYLRSLFKIPSGDMDLDSMPQTDNEDDQVALAGPRAKRKSSYEGKRDGTVTDFNKLVAAIAAATNRDDLQAIYMEHAGPSGPWSGMPSRWSDLLQDDFNAKMEGFAALTAAE